MNNHFITQIEIEKIKHLNNIKIKLDENKPKHLLLTGKNGSGKTTTLKAIKSNLRSIQMGNYIEVIEVWKKNVLEAKEKLNNEINENIRLCLLYTSPSPRD